MESNRIFDAIFDISIKNYPTMKFFFLHLLVKIWAYWTSIFALNLKQTKCIFFHSENSFDSPENLLRYEAVGKLLILYFTIRFTIRYEGKS